MLTPFLQDVTPVTSLIFPWNDVSFLTILACFTYTIWELPCFQPPKGLKEDANLTKILLAFQQQWCLRDLACVPCGFWVSPRTRGPNDLPWLLHHGARGSKATLRSGPRRVREAWLALIEQCEPDRNTGIRRSSVYDCLYFTILHILVSWIYVYVILCY